MVSKVLKKMEVLRGFVQIPAQSKLELIGDTSLPCATKLNDNEARLDKYGRLWSPSMKNKFSVGTRVEISRIENGYRVVPLLKEQERASSEMKQEEKAKQIKLHLRKHEIENPRESIDVTLTDLQDNLKKSYENYNGIVSYPSDMEVRGKKIWYGAFYKEGYDVILSRNDVTEFLKTVPDNIATLIVTSPPYNIGKPYEKRVELDQYLSWQENVIRECLRILKPEGSVCWEIGNYVENGEVYPLDIYFYDIFKELGLRLRNRIIWRFGHGLHAKLRFSGRYEVILWFTKSDHYTFNLDAIRIPQKYPGKTAYKGPNYGLPTSHPLGKNPTDVWDIILNDWEEEVWDIPNVKSNHPEKTVHPSQFPIELVERLVLALTNEDDIVLDPFVGVGSSLIASLLHGRRSIGVDKERIYTDIAYKRIVETLKGTLKKRPLGRPIWIPKGTEKVVKPPPEWTSEKLDKLTE